MKNSRKLLIAKAFLNTAEIRLTKQMIASKDGSYLTPLYVVERRYTGGTEWEARGRTTHNLIHGLKLFIAAQRREVS